MKSVARFLIVFAATAAATVLVSALIVGCFMKSGPETGILTEETQDEAFPPVVDEIVIPAPSEETVESVETVYMATDDLDFSDFVFIGDSRTVGMSSYVNTDIIADVGVGYYFLVEHYDEILELQDKNIVFNLGVNDLSHVQDYIEFYLGLPEQFCFDNHIYVVSVNPTSGEFASMNGNIDYFNVQLSDNLPSTIKWIDTCSFLREAGFGSPDGLHYDAITYETIANLIYNNVRLYQNLGY